MKVCINGFCGRMGQEIFLASKKFSDIDICFGIDTKERINSFPCNFSDVKLQASFDNVDCDIVIDFSCPKALPGVVEFCKRAGCALVIGTTGLGAKEKGLLEELSAKVPVFWSSNMSEGVFVVGKLVELATKMLDGWDIEILETHHSSKVDLPSGTALMLLDKVKDGRPHAREVVGRNACGARAVDEVGVHSIRAGGFCGSHNVLFAQDNQSVEISHVAFSKSAFAEGALKAAMFVHGKKFGMFCMDDLI